MQDVSSEFRAALIGTPKHLTKVVEIYHQDAVPGADGFDPASSDFIVGYAKKAGFSYRTRTYKRLLTGTSRTKRTIKKQLSGASFTLSNLTREVAQFERDTGFEGLICVIRLVDWQISEDLDDSSVVFTGRCKKPMDFARSNEQVTVSAEQILNQKEVPIPRRKYTPDDKEGRAVTDPLFEGFRFSQRGGKIPYTEKVKRGGIAGFFGFKKKVTRYKQWSSYSDLDSETPVPVALGRVQSLLTHIGAEDIGTEIRMLSAACDGPIAGFENVRSVTEGFPVTIVDTKLGQPGGTGNQINSDPSWVAAAIYSRLAYLRLKATGTDKLEDDPAPDVVAVILGMIIPVPDSNGDFTDEHWSDNPIYQGRWYVSDADYLKLDENWWDDEELIEEADFCDHILVDQSNSEKVLLNNSQSPFAGAQYKNYYSTGFISPITWKAELDLIERYEVASRESDYQFYSGVPYNSDDYLGIGLPNFNIGETPTNYRKRYTSNVLIGEETEAIDFLFDVLFPAANLFMVQKASGKLSIRVARPVNFTFMEAVSAVNDDEIKVRSINKWVANPGKILIGANLSTSEVRSVTGTRYDATVSISIAASGGVSTSSGTLTGGSSSVAPNATLTVSTATGTKTVTIDGYQLEYTAQSGDTTTTVAAQIAAQINSHEILNKYIKAEWNENTTLKVSSRIGFLELDSALEYAHKIGIADPTNAPAVSIQNGGSLAAGTYHSAFSYKLPTGETLTSPIKSVTVTAGKNLVFSAIALPPEAEEIYWYCSVEPQGVRLHRAKENDGSSWTLSKETLPRQDDPIEPYANLTSEEIHHVAMAFTDRAETRSALTRSNMVKGSFKYPMGGRQSSINQVIIDYRDSSQDFKRTKLVINDRKHQAKVKKPNKKEINGAAIDNYHQARRIGNQMLNIWREGDLFHGFTSDGEALLLEEGDVICVTDRSGEFVNEPVRIEELDIDDSGGYPKISIVARKYRRWFYDDQVVEKLIPLPIVQNAPVNVEQTAPTVNQPSSATPTAYDVELEIADYGIKSAARKIIVADNEALTINPVETIVTAENYPNRIFDAEQIVNNPSPQTSANTKYIGIATSSNGETFGEVSESIAVQFAGTSSGGGGSGSTQNSNLQGTWNETNDEADLTWVLGSPSGAQTLEKKLDTDSTWTTVSPDPATGAVSESVSITKQSTAKNWQFRVKQDDITGWSNTATVSVPATPQAPTLSGTWDENNDEVDLTAVAGAGGSGNFTFERKVTGTSDSTYVSIGTQASGSKSDSITKTGSVQSFTYRVKQATPDGIYSNTVVVEVPANTSPPTLTSASWNSGANQLDISSYANNGGTNPINVEYSIADLDEFGAAFGTLTTSGSSGSVAIVRETFDSLYDIRLHQPDTGYSNEITIFIPGTGQGGGS